MDGYVWVCVCVCVTWWLGRTLYNWSLTRPDAGPFEKFKFFSRGKSKSSANMGPPPHVSPNHTGDNNLKGDGMSIIIVLYYL